MWREFSYLRRGDRRGLSRERGEGVSLKFGKNGNFPKNEILDFFWMI